LSGAKQELSRAKQANSITRLSAADNLVGRKKTQKAQKGRE